MSKADMARKLIELGCDKSFHTLRRYSADALAAMLELAEAKPDDTNVPPPPQQPEVEQAPPPAQTVPVASAPIPVAMFAPAVQGPCKPRLGPMLRIQLLGKALLSALFGL